jgi:hypothetical protein
MELELQGLAPGWCDHSVRHAFHDPARMPKTKRVRKLLLFDHCKLDVASQILSSQWLADCCGKKAAGG